MNLSAKIRVWLGLDGLVTPAHLQAVELRMKQRAKAAHEAQMGMLNRIEQRMINEHIGNRPQQARTAEFAPAVLDWDTVQAIAYRELEKNPQKES